MKIINNELHLSFSDLIDADIDITNFCFPYRVILGYEFTKGELFVAYTELSTKQKQQLLNYLLLNKTSDEALRQYAIEMAFLDINQHHNKTIRILAISSIILSVIAIILNLFFI